jgi:thiosulfate/3-mercaptopyruvate sulfurtransferase
MQRSTRCRLALIGLCLLALPGTAVRLAAQSSAANDVLVTPAWLAEHLADPRVRTIDLGKTKAQFATGHVPGAQFVDWRVDIVDPRLPGQFVVAPAPAVEALLSRLGVDADTTVVLYDSQSSRIAARMFWMLRYYGHRDVRILDGGSSAWEAAGARIATVSTQFATTNYNIAESRLALRADSADVRSAVGQVDVELIDARAEEFYSGESFGSPFQAQQSNARAGHIPGAKNLFWADHYNPDGTFKSIAELRSAYAALGIQPGDTVISYCHVGLQASTPWFVLSELLGFADVRLYDASMAEWANMTDTELVLGNN